MKKLNLFILAIAASLCANAADLKDLKIYVNPGHGGHDSDDRNVAVPPFEGGDPEGFWESNSNLVKGLDLRDLLEKYGATVMMSRTTNTTEDDRDLHEIGYEANAFGADFFFSIHSNATGTASRYNQPLMLFRGFDDEPVKPADKAMAEVLNKHLLENRVTSWSSENTWIRGDYDFYDWGVGVGLGVLRKLTVPGLLSEGSHHDYIPETYRLLNKEYCWLEAYHFTKAIMEYFNASEKYTTGVVAGSIYDNRLVRTESIYGSTFYGHDHSRPILGAVVSLIDGNGNTVETYTTDQYQNGVYLFKSVAPGSYKVKVTHPEYRDFEKEVEVTANNVTYLNPEMSRIRNTAPEVVSYSPQWKEGEDGIICNARVEIDFNWDMDTESVEKNFSITPAVDGEILWEDSQYKFVFKPKRAFETNTVYTVKIGKDAKHPENIAMGKDFSFSFKTGDYNSFDVIATSPSDNDRLHYAKPYIELRFKQHPNAETIQKDIVIKNSAGETVSYNARSKKTSSLKDDFGYFQIRMSKDLEIGKTYVLDVNGNVRDRNDMPLEAPFQYTFTAVDAAAEGNLTMVNPLDDNNLIVVDEDAAKGIEKSSVARNSSTKLEGTASYKLDYTFSDFEGGNAAYKFAAAQNDKFTAADALGMKVYGDLSNNVLYVRIVNGTDVKLIYLCKLGFLGWRDVSASLADYGLNGEYTVDGFEVKQEGGQISKKGTLYIDKLAKGAAGDAGIDNVETANLRVYPNPVSDLLIANGDKHIIGVELISLDGKRVAVSETNVLNVSAIAEGVYVAKIYTNNGYGTKQVIVKH